MYGGYETVLLGDEKRPVGTGWLPPKPDLRDYNQKHPEVAPLKKELGLARTEKVLKAAMPPAVDLRPWCSPVEDQGNLGSCTANAAVGVVEYLERRAFGNHIDGSRLFVYKATRNLLGVTGDSGAWLRNTMGALRLCGVPPEKYWPYTDADPEFDEEPTSFVYAVGDNYEAIRYFAHDPLGDSRATSEVLTSVKSFLAAGIPSMFGFWGFNSFDYAAPDEIPLPCPGEHARWGHAIVAVGYDEKKKITNTLCNKTTTGALLIRNSWGTAWGNGGYGWIPYDYVRFGLALDFWSLISMKWVETKQFGV